MTDRTSTRRNRTAGNLHSISEFAERWGVSTAPCSGRSNRVRCAHTESGGSCGSLRRTPRTSETESRELSGVMYGHLEA
jgi:hypothetical protein